MLSPFQPFRPFAPPFLRAGTAGPVVPANQAMLDMYAHDGGQNGAYLDLTDMAYLRRGTTKASSPVTASGQLVGRVIDKSPNDRDIYSMVGLGESGTYLVDGAYSEVSFNTGFFGANGGGSNQNPTGGFYLIALLEPKGYYYTAWSDKNSAFAGRVLRYDPDVNGFIFDVGTGTARVKATVGNVATLYQTPPAGTKYVVQARHEGTTISLKVNALPEATATVPTYAVGADNFSVNGSYDVTGGTVGRIAICAHTLNPLTPDLRAASLAYVSTKKAP